MSSNGRSDLSPGMGIGFLNHHVKKESKMVVMMDLDQDLFLSTLMTIIVISGEKGVGYSSKSSTIVM